VYKDGERKPEECEAAKAFFQQRFGDLVEQTEMPNAFIERELVKLLHGDASANSNNCVLAETCLRCVISHLIEEVCKQFESKHGWKEDPEDGKKICLFTFHSLLPLVLDDDLKQKPLGCSSPEYRSLASQILQTFDPNKAGLRTWVDRQVQRHPAFHAFLLEHGIYLITDWAILNDTSLEKLQSVLSEFHTLTSIEIKQATQVLQGYHAVYRQDRLRLRQAGTIKGGAKCLPPTQDQLTRISEYLRSEFALALSQERIMSKLKNIAQQLREERIHQRRGQLPLRSIDNEKSKTYTLAQQIQAPEQEVEPDEQNEFLTFYRKQFLDCLHQAIEQVTSDRIAYYERKNRGTAEDFLTALYLFHCEGQAMGAIATAIGLTAQPQVSRLMNLKEFRANIRQRLMKQLQDCVLEKARLFADPVRLAGLDQRIEAALDEQLAAFFKQAESEAAVAKNCPLRSLFAIQLCQQLNAWRTEK
jgi:hypothetical protein